MLFLIPWEGPSGIRCLAPCLIRRRTLCGREFGVASLKLLLSPACARRNPTNHFVRPPILSARPLRPPRDRCHDNRCCCNAC
jgi:hypothetical protein